jgi:hypothetical protein
MNKVSRLLGSAALAAGLTVGGTALTAGAAYAGDDGNHHDRSSGNKYGHDKDNWKDHNGDGHERDKYDDNHRGDYKYVYDHKDDDHDEDCDGKYHRAWFKNNYGQWQFIIIIVYHD